MYEVTMYSNKGDVQKNEFLDNNFIDVYLLDHLRGYMSFGKKAFAVVSNEENVQFVVIEDNCTKWMSSQEFFEKIDIASCL